MLACGRTAAPSMHGQRPDAHASAWFASQLLCTDRGQVDHAEEVMVMKADVGHGGVLYVWW